MKFAVCIRYNKFQNEIKNQAVVNQDPIYKTRRAESRMQNRLDEINKSTGCKI